MREPLVTTTVSIDGTHAEILKLADRARASGLTAYMTSEAADDASIMIQSSDSGLTAREHFERLAPFFEPGAASSSP